jgi:hypothetical protein
MGLCQGRRPDGKEQEQIGAEGVPNERAILVFVEREQYFDALQKKGLNLGNILKGVLFQFAAEPHPSNFPQDHVSLGHEWRYEHETHE